MDLNVPQFTSAQLKSTFWLKILSENAKLSNAEKKKVGREFLWNSCRPD